LNRLKTAERPFVVLGESMDLQNGPEGIRIRDLAETSARDHFLELFDLKVRPQGRKLHLTVVLDRQGGSVTLDDCASVSRDLEKRLDETDLIGTSYLLEVSSPGLDRPLRGPEDYGRFRGRMARFVLAEPLEGLASFEGRLGETSDGRLEVKIGKQRVLWVPFASVKNAKLMVEM
jgi:ribosome maturation factor RimP